MIPSLLLLAAQPIADVRLELERNGREVFPEAFQGRWAKNSKECSKDGLLAFRITETHIYLYEGSEVLLKNGELSFESTDDGLEAPTVTSLVAYSDGEGDVGTGKIRLSRIGEFLHMSSPDEVSSRDHLTAQYRNVRCG